MNPQAPSVELRESILSILDGGPASGGEIFVVLNSDGWHEDAPADRRKFLSNNMSWLKKARKVERCDDGKRWRLLGQQEESFNGGLEGTGDAVPPTGHIAFSKEHDDEFDEVEEDGHVAGAPTAEDDPVSDALEQELEENRKPVSADWLKRAVVRPDAVLKIDIHLCFTPEDIVQLSDDGHLLKILEAASILLMVTGDPE